MRSRSEFEEAICVGADLPSSSFPITTLIRATPMAGIERKSWQHWSMASSSWLYASRLL